MNNKSNETLTNLEFHINVYSICAIIIGFIGFFSNGILVYVSYIDRKLLASKSNFLIGMLSAFEFNASICLFGVCFLM